MSPPKAAAATLLTLATTLICACDRAEPPARPGVAVEPGVSEPLARQRAARLSNIHYTLHFSIPRDSDEDIDARLKLDFDLGDAGEPLQLDFRADNNAIDEVLVNGTQGSHTFESEHIVIPAAALSAGSNTVEIAFTAGSSSLNRNPEYLYTLFVPDRARTAFPLFDQPDLKATYDLTLDVPADWVALSNGPLAATTRSDDRVEYRFETSDLISSYLFSFVAGKFEVLSAARNGRTMTMLHRETDGAKVERNLAQIFDLHAASIDWLEQYTGIDYPFRKFDFALLPAYPYGGMEHVGAIQYRASSLLLDEAASDDQLLNRATLIAHETAHMWFGNLVTMGWFNDVWTKEVFANFMAAKIINPSFPAIDHELSFLVDHYPAAYAVDRSAGANPIRQELPNLRDAGQMYGAIIYHKAPIMMRQLELLLGEEKLRAGLAEYLETFAFANATWPDLIRILDAKTDTDLSAWSQVWVNTSGRPEFEVTANPAGMLQLHQIDPAGLGRVWPQQLTLRTPGGDGGNTVSLSSTAAVTPLPPAAAQGDTLLINAGGMGYGLFPATLGTLAAWETYRPVDRGEILVDLYENLLAGSKIGSEAYYLELLRILPEEDNQLLIGLMLGQIARIHHSLLSPPQRARHQAALEEILWQTMSRQANSSNTKTFFNAFAALSTSPQASAKVFAVWVGELEIDRLKLAENDFIALAETLALRFPAKAEQIIAEQLAKTANPDSRRRLAFIAPALAADTSRRDAFFASLADESNRRTESWVLDALAWLHHPSRVAHSEKYLRPSLELLEEIQRTGDIFFPGAWLGVSLRNHHSAAAIETVRTFLAERPDYNPQLRMKVLQALDMPLRANAILSAMVE